MDQTFTLAMRKAALEALKGTGKPLNAPTLILLTNPDVGDNPRAVIGDLTEATFAGYAASTALAFGAAYTDGADNVKMTAPSVQFTATDGVTPNTITGWALVKADKTEVYYVAKLDESALLNEAGDALIVVPTVVYGE